MGLAKMARFAVICNAVRELFGRQSRSIPTASTLNRALALLSSAAGCLTVFFAAAAQAQDSDDDKQADARSSIAARMILVIGAAGTSEYRQQFQEDAQQWASLAGNRDMLLVTIDESDTADDRSHHDSLRESIAKAVTEMPEQLWIVLIGHGTSERGIHKFNLVGPDVSSKELAQWLQAFTNKTVIINCSSASAPFLPELSAPHRIVATATRSGTENNYSRFGTQLAGCILDPATDIDHDEEVSLLEAFLAAAAKTEKFYSEQNRLATEHALIDDNGDKLGTGAEFFRGTRAVKAAQAGKQPDGQVAARLILHSSKNAPKLTQAAQTQRAEIEAQIEQLRARKPAPPDEAYWNELETLLLQLAELYANSASESNVTDGPVEQRPTR